MTPVALTLLAANIGAFLLQGAAGPEFILRFAPWPPGAQQPASGEFPFYPEEGVDRDYYEKARAARAPLFCYVQGMESMSCVAIIEGGMVKLGVQSFPG